MLRNGDELRRKAAREYLVLKSYIYNQLLREYRAWMEEESGFGDKQAFRLDRIVTFFAEARFTFTKPAFPGTQNR